MERQNLNQIFNYELREFGQLSLDARFKSPRAIMLLQNRIKLIGPNQPNRVGFHIIFT